MISKQQLWRTLLQYVQKENLVVGLAGNKDCMGDFQKALGQPFFYADHSYFQRGWDKRNFRLVRGAAHVTRIFPAASDRLQKFGVKIRPWRRDGKKIIVIKPSEYLETYLGLTGWMDRSIAEIQKYTDREIVIREKKGDFLESIKDAWAVVSATSVAAVEAVIDGVPCFSTPHCPSWPVSAGELSQIESPQYLERYEWANGLAWASWNTEEVTKIDWKHYQIDGPFVLDKAQVGPTPAEASFRSQFDEDIHIFNVLEEIGTGTRVLCDIGARLGGSNTANLVKNRGFDGVLVDANADACKELRKYFPHVTVIHKKAIPQEVNEICPADAWVLSLDVDSCDWWFWANLIHRPALVVVETSPVPGMFIAKMECDRADMKGYGMSLEAAKWLGEAKGYDYIGSTVVNAFFVRKDLKCQYRLPEPKSHYGASCGAANNVLWATDTTNC